MSFFANLDRESWRYANVPNLERLVFAPGQGAWRKPTTNHDQYEWIDDGVTATLRVPERTNLTIDTVHELAAGQESIKLNIQVGAGATLTGQLGLQASDGALLKLKARINLAEGATMNHLRMPLVGASGYLFTNTTVDLAADATYNYFNVTDCGAQVRHQFTVNLNGKNACAKLGGIYTLRNAQVGEHALTINHNAPDTSSQQLFRGTADGNSRGVFQGKIVVAKGADRTDAQQNHKALLLSPRAEIDAKPELEIYADEVKCSHGASVGALDQNALFYLRSRGIGAAEAKALLTKAFVAEAIALAPQFADALEARLAHAAA